MEKGHRNANRFYANKTFCNQKANFSNSPVAKWFMVHQWAMAHWLRTTALTFKTLKHLSLMPLLDLSWMAEFFLIKCYLRR